MSREGLRSSRNSTRRSTDREKFNTANDVCRRTSYTNDTLELYSLSGKTEKKIFPTTILLRNIRDADRNATHVKTNALCEKYLLMTLDTYDHNCAVK